MDLKAMCVDELVVFLSSKGISKEICEQLEENAIDGQTLGALIDDNDEFVSVIPKGGHRLQLKKVVKALVDIEEEKDKSDLTTSMTFSPDNALKTIPSKPISNTPSKPIVMQTLDFCGFEVRNEECAESCEQKTGKEKCNYQSDKSPNSVDTLPQNLPFPERLSIKVEAAINNGSVASERTQLIADIGTFYFGLSHHPRQGDYKRIAILVCERFPELRDSNPSNYWVSIQRQLSQYFRNLRRRTAVKASICDNTKESSAKKAKL
ncbi:uncharacterized protein LOC114519757, partial [Dendronephthya gigantea]|uniref:uncharacterized protein LOC114519757 n=1 Tax=Dendronephthya gigantea TaxID=151771 RepID=UPI001069D6B5